jgi:hypothetical protein
MAGAFEKMSSYIDISAEEARSRLSAFALGAASPWREASVLICVHLWQKSERARPDFPSHPKLCHALPGVLKNKKRFFIFIPNGFQEGRTRGVSRIWCISRLKTLCSPAGGKKEKIEPHRSVALRCSLLRNFEKKIIFRLFVERKWGRPGPVGHILPHRFDRIRKPEFRPFSNQFRPKMFVLPKEDAHLPNTCNLTIGSFVSRLGTQL